MNVSRPLIALGLLAATLGPVAADQIFIRNKPFTGATVTTDGKLWVELKPLADAFQATLVDNGQGGYLLQTAKTPGDAAEIPANKLKVGETLVDVQTVEGVQMVVLEDFAKGVNARVTPNKALKTIDVNLTSAKMADAAPAPSASSSGPKKGGGGNILRIRGKITLPGANAVGLFEGGSSDTPYKTGTVDRQGNYYIDIDLTKDLHSVQGALMTDMRFYKEGAFGQCHGRCNFVYKMNGKLSLQVYEGPTYDIKGRDFEYTEQN